MRAIVAIIVFGLGTMGLAAVSTGQPCYRMICNQSQTCQAQQTSTGGKYCCNVACEGGEGGVNCVCSTFCDLACGGAPPNCDYGCGDLMGTAVGDGFVYQPDAHPRVMESYPTAALLLRNLRSKDNRIVRSAVVTGTGNVGDGPFAYKALVQADPSRVRIDFTFDRLGDGPVLEPVRVDIDREGFVTILPLGADGAEVVRRASRHCSSSPGNEEPTVTDAS